MLFDSMNYEGFLFNFLHVGEKQIDAVALNPADRDCEVQPIFGPRVR
jgi:hypothetical protein